MPGLVPGIDVFGIRRIAAFTFRSPTWWADPPRQDEASPSDHLNFQDAAPGSLRLGKNVVPARQKRLTVL